MKLIKVPQLRHGVPQLVTRPKTGLCEGLDAVEGLKENERYNDVLNEVKRHEEVVMMANWKAKVWSDVKRE